VERFELPADLAEALCAHLGVGLPGDAAGVAALFRAWCTAVPVDNVGKEEARVAGGIPPGDDPVQVAEELLATGLGGTCWSHSTGLAGILTAAGARATVGLDRMVRDDGIVDFHSFTVLHEDGGPWVLDPIWPTVDPLPLRAGARGGHPVVPVGLDEDGDGLRLWHWAEPGDRRLRYAVVSTVLDRDDVRAWCELSLRFSGVPAQVLNLRRNPPDRVEATLTSRHPGSGVAPGELVVRRRTAGGVTERSFTDPDEVFAEFGCTPEARRRAERAGLLAP
jgi:hypothetical protein